MKILLVPGGGTGGHIFPALALAEGFSQKGVREIVFVGTKRGLQQKFLSQTKWRFLMIDAPSFADKMGWKKLTTLFGLVKSFFKAASLLAQEKPDVVIGVGGYVSFPVLFIAAISGRPTWMIEPNARPGLANRYLKYFVDHIVVAYPGMEAFFNRKKIRVWGVPIRSNILAGKTISGELSSTPQRKKTILLMGGSQGAQSLNAMMWQALPKFKDLKEKIHFVHQIGSKENVDVAKSFYQSHGFTAEVFSFIEEMGSVLRRSDFAIARSGGNTVAELMAVKLPSLLIPYPHSRDKHQEANARALERLGGSKVCLESELTPENFAAVIRDVAQNPQFLKEMRQNLDRVDTSNATQKIVEACLRCVTK